MNRLRAFYSAIRPLTIPLWFLLAWVIVGLSAITIAVVLNYAETVEQGVGLAVLALVYGAIGISLLATTPSGEILSHILHRRIRYRWHRFFK